MGTVRTAVGDVVGGRYELEELIGTGGMSSVYKARDSLLERHVALKILHPHFADDDEFVERFRREARSVAQLSHPNIVTVIDRGEDGGHQYIVFEYVPGENLKQVLHRTGALPVREALHVALQIARALAFAHEHSLVHRDVKPQNVLMNGDGRAKVTDFGIARSLDVAAGVTQTGTVLGTSDYIAPEQASGQRVDAQTDVYSLGVVLFELLTGDVPFPGESFVAVAMKHVHEPPPNVRDVRGDVPPRVAAAVDRALAKDPAARFPSMDAFAAELEACLAELARPEDADVTMVVPARVRARAVGAPAQPHRRRRRLWPLVLAVLALAALVAGVVLLATHRSSLPAVVGGGSPASKSIHLTGVGAYDPPPGDGAEHDSDAHFAADGESSTYWSTEHYNSFSKPGVGLVLDAGRAVRARTVTVSSETPGFTAQIEGGAARGGPFRVLSPRHAVDGTTTFRLTSKTSVRYLVLWITSLPSGFARVNEVRAHT